MKTYSQQTLPIQSGKLLHECPVCKAKYMIRAETGNGAIYYHQRCPGSENRGQYLCVVKT